MGDWKILCWARPSSGASDGVQGEMMKGKDMMGMSESREEESRGERRQSTCGYKGWLD